MSQYPSRAPYGSGDYEYDEAHAAVEARDPDAPADERQRPTYVSTQTPGYTGDYSYDMAHDIPPGTGV